MSWDKTKGGFFCDRCDAYIAMNFRQEKFMKPTDHFTIRNAGDPYVSVTVNFFLNDKQSTTLNGFHFCFDCEPIVMAAVREVATVRKEKENAEQNQTGSDSGKTYHP